MDRIDVTLEQMEKINSCKTPKELLALAREEGVELTTDELDAICSGDPAWFEADSIKRRFGNRCAHIEPAFDLDLELEKEAARKHGYDRGTDRRARVFGDTLV